MRILVLVLGARTAPYPALIRAIKKTWASVNVPGVDTLFYSGGPALRLDGPDLTLPVPDDLAHVGQKTLVCFQYVLEHGRFDLVFRTNCSSYVDLPNLRAFTEERGRGDRFYAGLPGMHDGVPFASGSGYFLSRDLVELAVEEQDRWDHAVLDDVALGGLLAFHGVRPEPTPRRDYRSLAEVEHVDTSQFHFRCRTESWRRLEDARVLEAVHRVFCEARGLPAPSSALRPLDRIGAGTARLLGRVAGSR